MATITTRAGKGSPLTNSEVDSNFTNINTELGQKESASNKGVANGYASLDGSGKVPSAQLPSYVDDVVEGANLAALPATGETGKIYVTLDTNKTYRWSGSAYVEISASPGSTDAVTEGSTNLYFTNARARASVTASGSLSYNNTTGIFSYTTPNSDGITEGSTNLYFTNARARSAVSATGSLSYNSSTGVFSFTDAVTSVAGRTGAVTLTSSDVGLGNVENKSSATIRGELTSGNVTTALGYTPYNSTNPSGYITSSASITGAAGRVTQLGTRTAESGTTVSTPSSSMDVVGAYNNGYPDAYGNVISVNGGGSSQLYLGWVGGSGAETGEIYYRSMTDWRTNWGSWRRVLTNANYSSYALPLSGGTMTGVITTVSSGTAINFAGQSDSFGYNATANLGTYIKGTGSTYLYGGGEFYDGTASRQLLHSGNYSGYTVARAGGSFVGRVVFPSGVFDRPQLPGGILGLDAGDGNFDIWGISRDYYPSHATAGNAWGIRWDGDSNQVRFIGAGTTRLAVDLDGGASGLTWEGSTVAHGGNFTTFSLSSGQVTTALGFTPYNSTNPAGYITSSALSSYLPLSGGTMSGAILLGSGVPVRDVSGEWIIGKNSAEISIGSAAVTNGIAFNSASNSTFTYRGQQILHAGNYSSYALPLSGGTVSGSLTVTSNFTLGGYLQNDPESGLWYSPGNFAYDATNGTRYYWHKICNLSDTSIALIEYHAKDDSNYPNSQRGWVDVASYVGSSVSVKHDAVGAANAQPQVRVDNNSDVWIRFPNITWNHYVTMRVLHRSGVTVYRNDTKQFDTPANSIEILPGQQVRATRGNVTGATVENTTEYIGGQYARGNVEINGYLGIGQGPNTGYRLITNGHVYANSNGNVYAEGRHYSRHGTGTFYESLTTGNYNSYALPLGGGTLTGGRPIEINTSGGYIAMKGDSGGWSMGTYFKGSAGTTRAGFGAYGGGDSLGYAWIGTGYDGAWLTLTPSAVNSQVALQQGGNQVLHAGNYTSYTLDSVRGDVGAYNLNTSGQHAWARFSTGAWANGPISGNYSHVLSFNGATDNRTVQMYLGDIPGAIYWRPCQAGTWHPWERFLTSNSYNSYSPTLTGGGASGTWGINVTGAAGYSYYLPTAYIGGQQLNPQTYFNNGVGLKVAMTAAAGVWSDTLWINGYAGGDVLQMCALHFQRNGTPRMYISNQASTSTSYGTLYEILSTYNYTSYSPSLTGSGASGTWGISITGSAGTLGGRVAGNSTDNLAYFNGSRNLFVNNPESYSGEVRLGAAWSRGGVYASGTLSLSSGGSEIHFVTGDVVRAWVNSSSQINAGGGYISNSNPWGTSNSAYFPNGITTPNTTNWIYGHCYLGNAPSNGSGAQIESNGKYYSQVSSGLAMHVRSTRSSSETAMLVEQSRGDHSWGIVSEFRVGADAGTDRPSILFSSGHNSDTWTVGFGYVDSNFRINRDHGYRNGNWGTTMMVMDRSGNVTFTGNVTAYSDRRLKQNIKRIESASDIVRKLEGVSFEYIEDGRPGIGLIAQDVEGVLPELVGEATSSAGETYKNVAYGNIVAVLIEAIKELQVELAEVKSKLH